MWSEVASLASRLRVSRRPGRGAGPTPEGAGGSGGGRGISWANTGRAPPRRLPPLRRAPALTAATTGCAPGGGAPTSLHTAAMAQQVVLVQP
jgi:hypothetical protein